MRHLPRWVVANVASTFIWRRVDTG